MTEEEFDIHEAYRCYAYMMLMFDCHERTKGQVSGHGLRGGFVSRSTVDERSGILEVDPSGGGVIGDSWHSSLQGGIRWPGTLTPFQGRQCLQFLVFLPAG